MSEVLLEIKDICFAYGKKEILKHIGMKVRRGERIAVMGPNGAGKSTFFLNLNGVLQADSGEIFLAGQKITKKELSTLRKKIGFVFQDADSQIIAPNVRAEISFGPMNMGLTRAEVGKRVDDAVAYLSLEDLQERAPHYLSGGEKKRVSIADILAMEPEVLIFDEPMAALDPMNAERVEEILTRLHEEGKTLLIATHDVDFAYRFADRVLVFSEGSLLADGKPAEIFQKEELLKKTHLKKPAVLQVWEALLKSGKVTEEEAYPVTVDEVVKGILQ